MGAVPVRILVRCIWSPPDVLGVSGYSSKRPRWPRHVFAIDPRPGEAIISPNTGNIFDAKQTLRRELRMARHNWVNTLPDASRKSAFHNPPQEFLQILDSHAVIGGYVAMRDEAKPAPILHYAMQNGQTIALPYFADKDAMMEFRHWNLGDPLHLGPFGMGQPDATSAKLQPSALICPLIAFTRCGARLGQGGGHYDRYCTQNPGAMRIGMGWSMQEIEDIPAEAHDVPLHGILTEKKWITPAKGNQNG